MNKNRKSVWQNALLAPVTGYFKHNLGIMIGLCGLIVVLSITSDKFLDVANILNILRQMTINVLLAFGVSFTLILGGVDLSVGSVLTTCGIFTVQLLKYGVPVSIAVAAGIFLGITFGLVNGFIVAQTGMHPFVVTLATQMVIRGFAYIITSGVSISTTNETFSFIGNGYVGPIPFPILLLLIIMCIDACILNRTKFGRRLYATGANPEAATYSGVNTYRIKLGAYTMSGAMAAIAGIILASRMYSGQPTAGVGYEGDAIAASVLGGVSFTGGVGTIGGCLIGGIMIGVINNGMNLLQIPFYWQLVVKGIVILLAVYIDIMKKRKG